MKRTERIVSEDELEMFTALYHLRYLTLAQIHRLWYPERTANGCSVRVARITASKHLHRTLYRAREGAAYSLGVEGLRALREFRSGNFPVTPELSAIWLPHHLATNSVFAALAPALPTAWDALPFRWLGTLNSVFRFEESRRDPYGALRKRKALLRPDAVVEVEASGPRVLLELDRSTEKLTEDDERRSIRRKLRSYSTVLYRGRVNSSKTWYQEVYADSRKPRIVFVLEKADDVGNHRRTRAIEDAAGEIDARMDVHCVYLRDTQGIRRAFALGPAGALASTSQAQVSAATTLGTDDLKRLTDYYRLSVSELRHQTSDNPALRDAAVEARNVLRRLRGEIGESRGQA